MNTATKTLDTKLLVILYDRKTNETGVASIPLDENVTGTHIKLLVSSFSKQYPAADPAYIIEKNQAYRIGQFTGDVDIVRELFEQYAIPESRLRRIAGEEIPAYMEEAALASKHSPTPQLN